MKTVKHYCCINAVQFPIILYNLELLTLTSTLHFEFAKSIPNHVTGHGSQSAQGDKVSETVKSLSTHEFIVLFDFST